MLLSMFLCNCIAGKGERGGRGEGGPIRLSCPKYFLNDTHLFSSLFLFSFAQTKHAELPAEEGEQLAKNVHTLYSSLCYTDHFQVGSVSVP